MFCITNRRAKFVENHIMSSAIASLEPKAIWANFDRLNAVPRASKKEETVIQFIKDFGQNLGLPTEIGRAHV